MGINPMTPTLMPQVNMTDGFDAYQRQAMNNMGLRQARANMAIQREQQDLANQQFAIAKAAQDQKAAEDLSFRTDYQNYIQGGESLKDFQNKHIGRLDQITKLVEANENIDNKIEAKTISETIGSLLKGDEAAREYFEHKISAANTSGNRDVADAFKRELGRLKKFGPEPLLRSARFKLSRVDEEAAKNYASNSSAYKSWADAEDARAQTPSIIAEREAATESVRSKTEAAKAEQLHVKEQRESAKNRKAPLAKEARASYAKAGIVGKEAMKKLKPVRDLISKIPSGEVGGIWRANVEKFQTMIDGGDINVSSWLQKLEGVKINDILGRRPPGALSEKEGAWLQGAAPGAGASAEVLTDYLTTMEEALDRTRKIALFEQKWIDKNGDVTSASDTITIDGKEYPAGSNMTVAIQEKFYPEGTTFASDSPKTETSSIDSFVDDL